MTLSIKEICKYLDEKDFKYTYVGDNALCVKTFCSLNNLKSESVTWIKNVENICFDTFENIHNCIVIAKSIPFQKHDFAFILTDEPKAVFFSILDKFWSTEIKKEISSSAIVKSHKIDENVSIGDNTFIDADVSIGENTIIENNVVIQNKVSVGKNCIIHSGVVIGADGFGFYFDDEGFPKKVDHFGGVQIGDDVEIGANSCIDRGTIDDTILEDKVKIDNLVHIGHNCRIGSGALVVAGAIMCGSAKIGEKSYVAPGGIVKNQLKLGNGAFVGLGAVVTKNVEEDMLVVGVPAKPIRKVRQGDK